MNDLQDPASDTFPFFELTPDLVCIAGKDGFFKKINPSVIQKLGYTEAELLAVPIATFMHPDDREETLRGRSELIEGKALINYQNRYVTQSGGIIWLDWTSIYLADRELIFAIAKDVTQRKQIEKEVEEEYNKFKQLATHFKSRMEKDRKHFAGELHEEIAQLASVIKMDVDWIHANIPDVPGPLQSRSEHAVAVSALLIETIRRISFSVSPYMLHNLGLHATLRLLCKEFTILNNTPCQFTGNCAETKLTTEVQLDFFRICQEALKNVMQHAQANSVKISIDDLDGSIRLSIADDGKGFDTDTKQSMPGLISMRELAVSINGKLTIHSATGEGTMIWVTVPG